MQQSCLTVCGPNTYTNFQSFSINGAIQELREQVPDIHELFMQLGDVHRNLDMNDTRNESCQLTLHSTQCEVQQGEGDTTGAYTTCNNDLQPWNAQFSACKIMKAS